MLNQVGVVYPDCVSPNEYAFCRPLCGEVAP